MAERTDYHWEAGFKEVYLPYICKSKCPRGYKWYRKSDKCLNIVDGSKDSEPKLFEHPI